MARNSLAFDLQDELAAALDWIWAYKAERRAEMEAKGDTQDRWYAEHTYTTATELERRVRAALAEKADRKPYGSCEFRDFSHSGYRINGLNGIPLLQHCRTFLLRSGLERHNFGRGHVSGERFRAPGVEMPETEVNTLKAKEKVKPVHIKRESAYAPLCTASRKAKGFYRPRRPASNVTSDPTKVTCKQCLRLLAEQVK